MMSMSEYADVLRNFRIVEHDEYIELIHYCYNDILG